jgi:cyclic pyranopterin phosphate synthase
MILPILESSVVPAPLSDALGRTLGYLRLSITKACSMRCVYCRPAALDNPRGQPLLGVDEIGAIVDHLAERHALRKVRVTGGEPTTRADLTDILRRIASVPGVRDLAMTTNGLTLARRAADYVASGLKRVNISLDTLDARRFEALTGVNEVDRVVDGIDAAIDAGLGPVKLNAVVVRGMNDGQDLRDLLEFAADRRVEMRFIELMPMGPLADRWAERFVPEARMRRAIEPMVAAWTPMEQGADSARNFAVELRDGRRAVVGFITPMSCNFCAACNRIRIAADGSWYPCLMDRPAAEPLLGAIRPRFDPVRFDEILWRGLDGKAAEHPAAGPAVMTHIGG